MSKRVLYFPPAYLCLPPVYIDLPDATAQGLVDSGLGAFPIVLPHEVSIAPIMPPVAGVPTINFAVAAVAVAEGDSGIKIVANTITVARNGVTGALVVNLLTGGTASAGTDYVALPATVTIQAGSDTVSFDLTVNGDTTVETNETVIINAALAAYLSATASKTVTITNDDVTVSALSISSTPTPRPVGDSTIFSPMISGGTTPYALAQTGGRMAPGRALSGLNVTGTYTHPGTYNYQLTVTDSANPAATAILNAKAIVNGAANGDEAVMNPLPTTPRSTYSFRETARIQPRPPGMTTGYGPFYPDLTDVREDPFWKPLGIKWLSHYSTDHASGAGGVWLSYSTLADLTDSDGWVTYDVGLARGDFASVATKPAGNPIFTRGGSLQTETPRVRKIGDTWVMLYQINAITGYRNQGTCRVLSADGLNWTGTKTDGLLRTTTSQSIGDGHTGYANFGPNPYSRSIYPYEYLIVSLNGGTDRASQAIWGVDDMVNGTPVFLENLVAQAGRLSTGTTRMAFSVTDYDFGSITPVRQGFSLITGLATSGSAGNSTIGVVSEVVVGPNGYDIIGEHIPIMEPTGGAGDAKSTSNQSLYLARVKTLDDRRVLLYEGTDTASGDSHENNVSIASGPRRNPANTWFKPLEPAIPVSLTTREINFKTASALPAWLTPITNGSFAPTFDATNGFGIDAASSASLYEYYLLGEEIPAGANFVDICATDERTLDGTMYRRLLCGISMTTAAFTTIAGINGNGLRVRSLGTNGVDIRMGSVVGGTETAVSISTYAGFGYGTVGANAPRAVGVRWFPNTGRAFLLLEGKMQWGIEHQEIAVPAALKPGGASFSGTIRPWFGFQTVANQAVKERIGALRYRFG